MQFSLLCFCSLHPGDLYPFTRKPLFIIVDSSNSVAYKNFTNLFGQPLVCLLSPTAYPKALQGTGFSLHVCMCSSLLDSSLTASAQVGSPLCWRPVLVSCCCTGLEFLHLLPPQHLG
ncbi:hypothetical protein FKM82_030955 [Ascaphus truei]